MAEIRTKEKVSYSYEVTDAFNHTRSFDNIEEAKDWSRYVDLQKTIIERYIKPKGITLVLCKNPNVFYKVYPCFIGWNGVPFCEVLADKERNYFMNLSNTIQRFSSIHGYLHEAIQQAYELLSATGNKTFDFWNGACHYHWNHVTGNEFAFYAGEYWLNDVLWYNWDGKHFTTNDDGCTLTDNSFKV